MPISKPGGRRVIVADENILCVREWFAPLGEVRTRAGRTLRAADVADADILLVRSVTAVDAALLAGSRVGFVGTATIGTDHLDLDYLRTAGIQVASAPGSNAQAVVDYVLSALATLDDGFERLLNGAAAVGVVGLGNVGGRLLRRLCQLGIDAVGFDPYVTSADLPQLSLAQVLARDVVCLHTPLTRSGAHPTLHLLNAQRLAVLKSGAVLLNAGRGPAIDNRALASLLDRRRDLRVLLDVWESEPGIDIDLLDRVTLATPHVAGYSFDGKLAGTRMLLEACCAFLGESQTPWADTSDVPRIVVTPGVDAITTLRRALLTVYDPRRDDAALRAGKGSVSMAVHFDQLRKQYPVRREIAGCVVANWAELAPEAQRLLAAAGFLEGGVG